MPFLLGLIKNPKVIMWSIMLTVMAVLFFYGKIQYVQIKELRTNLAVSTQNISNLGNVIISQEVRYRNLQSDFNAKDKVLSAISDQRDKLSEDYQNLVDRLADIDTVTPTSPPELIKRVETYVPNSYACIEKATGNARAVCQ